jgi:TetR/AcrR family transcriptional regulator
MTEPARTRDANASRDTILDAAETLFATQGYANTSMSDVGQAAGVSRGTPGYFFGSKENLYQAVLERAFSRIHIFIDTPTSTADEPAVVLEQFIHNYIDFLAANPNIVRLVERESLNNGTALVKNPTHFKTLADGLTSLQQGLAQQGVTTIDPKQFLISILSLCWFPFVHTSTLLPTLGLDANDPAFLAARKQHVTQLVLASLGVKKR